MSGFQPQGDAGRRRQTRLEHKIVLYGARVGGGRADKSVVCEGGGLHRDILYADGKEPLMNCRERAMRAIRREGPDRTPVGYSLSLGADHGFLPQGG